MRSIRNNAVVFLVLLLLLLVGGVVLLSMVNRMMDRSLNPLSEANDQLQTQVNALLNPTPTIIPDPVTIIHDVQSLARLETIQYSVEKVITAEVGQGSFEFLFGDRLLFVAHGRVIAGVDLAKISDQDLWLQGETLYVKLPSAEVFVAELDNDKSYVFDRQTGLLAQQNVNLETQARQVAESEILKAALNDGILAQAQINAENYLMRLFRQLGYPSVIFVQPNATPQP
ncbi:MAG: DUF4230 domain-containing protein [Anaerolinea sp.]|nr:DUF4230 domain-containing protein [Anaerolinea sp.]